MNSLCPRTDELLETSCHEKPIKVKKKTIPATKQRNVQNMHLPRHRVDTADHMHFSCEKLIKPSFPPRISGSLMSPLSISALLYRRQTFILN